jgi:hypothetical protein
MTWLEDLKPGDEVVLYDTGFTLPRPIITKVGRATKCFVFVAGFKIKRSDGYDAACSVYITPATGNGLREAACAMFARVVKYGKPSDNLLRRLLGILEEQP